MRFQQTLLFLTLMLLAFGCGRKEAGGDATPSSWTPVLGSCTVASEKNCFLSDRTSGMIWSQTYVSPLSQNEANARCRALNMRLPTFREYAIAARNGMLDVSHVYPTFGDVESLLWTAESATYIAFTNNTAAKRQGSAPARFKCTTGESVPSLNPRPGSEPVLNDTSSSAAHANNCGELRTLDQCGTNELCVWTHRGCLGIEGILATRPS